MSRIEALEADGEDGSDYKLTGKQESIWIKIGDRNLHVYTALDCDEPFFVVEVFADDNVADNDPTYRITCDAEKS